MNFLNKMNFTCIVIIIIIAMATLHLYNIKNVDKFEDIAVEDNQIVSADVNILIPSMNQVVFNGEQLNTIMDEKVSKTELNDAMPELSVISYAGSNAPTGWQLCDGQPLLKRGMSSSNPYRFIISRDGNSTVKTPDLRGRFILGSGTGTGTDLGNGLTNRVIHDTGGEENHTLTINEIPSHHHSLIAYDTGGDYGPGNQDGTIGQGGNRPNNPNGAQGGGPTGDILTTDNTNVSPKEMPHNNMPPYYVLTYIIKQPSPAS